MTKLHFIFAVSLLSIVLVGFLDFQTDAQTSMLLLFAATLLPHGITARLKEYSGHCRCLPAGGQLSEPFECLF